MKLIKTESRYGTPNGYFDPTTGIYYKVDGEHPFWVVARLPTKAEISLTPTFVDYDDALTELDRIAALIGGTAPAQGWVKGAPPLVEGAWLLAAGAYRNPIAVMCIHPSFDFPWEDHCGNKYASSTFTHHQPTPIVLP